MKDCDSKTTTKIQGKKTPFGILQRDISNASHVLSPLWLRRAIQADHGLDRLVLGGGYSFLWDFRLFFCIIYLVYTLAK